ncbi:MAG: hypothetical protein JNL47_10150 [Bacteroidia bacterium]|nr:hypothetical protein [Bacteroidia bacterium]
MLILFIGFRAGFRTPLDEISKLAEEVLNFFLIGFMLFRITQWITQKEKISRYEALMMLMMVFPVWSAVASAINFGQPLVYGIGTTRNFYLFLLGPFFYYLLHKKIISLVFLKNTMLAASWCTLAVFIVIYLTINPEKYPDRFFIGFNELKGGYIFKFNIAILIFALLYYSIRYLSTHRLLYLLASVPFYYMMLSIRQDRSIIIMTLLVLLIFYFKRIFFQSALRYSALIILLIFTGYFVIEITDYKPSEQSVNRFYNLWLTVTGRETDESATNIRRLEVIKAWPDIEKRFLFGNGELSPRWQDGFSRIYGYFYPSDIGIIGILYLFGVTGTLLLFVQFLFARKIVIKLTLNDPFVITCVYYLLFCFFDTFTSGQSAFFPANSTMVIAILYYAYRKHEPELIHSTNPYSFIMFQNKTQIRHA